MRRKNFIQWSKNGNADFSAYKSSSPIHGAKELQMQDRKNEGERQANKGGNIHVFSGNRWRSSRNLNTSSSPSFYGLIFWLW
jgi:hypothetical protein